MGPEHVIFLVSGDCNGVYRGLWAKQEIGVHVAVNTEQSQFYMQEFVRESPTGKGLDRQGKLSNILKYNTHSTAPQTYGIMRTLQRLA